MRNSGKRTISGMNYSKLSRNFNMLTSHPHRRYNPLKGEWILVSPQRTARPWQGKFEPKTQKKVAKYDPNCYLCPGNIRANGNKNPDYNNTFVFTNDFPAMAYDAHVSNKDKVGLLTSETVSGECRVICFSKRHDLTLADMTVEEIELVINIWIDQTKDLQKHFNWIQIFENKGEMMGCSNPHPHGQIWASNFIPNEVYKEDIQQKKYFKKYHSPLLFDYVQEELKRKERIVIENNSWIVVVPFWAIWPFETLLLSKKHIVSFTDLSKDGLKTLANIMKKLLVVYDKLFQTSMPYSMGWHFAPLNQKNPQYWQLHAHYYPPLLRSATVKKFMVGYEMLSEAQRDITPEQAAKRLRSLI